MPEEPIQNAPEANPIDSLTADERTAYLTASHPQHAATVEKVTRLFDAQHGVTEEYGEFVIDPEKAGRFDLQAYLSEPTRANMKAAYFDRNNPGHEDAVNHIQRLMLMQTKQDDQVEGKELGLEKFDENEPTFPVLSGGREWDESVAGQAVSVALEAGIPPVLLQEAIDVYAKTGAPPMSADEGEKILRGKLGDKYEDTLEAADRALDDFPAMRKFLKDVGLLNDPGLIIHLAKQGASRGGVQQQIKELMAPGTAYWKREHPDHEAAVEKVFSLRQKIGGK